MEDDVFMAMLQGMDPGNTKALASKLRGQDLFGKVYGASLDPNAQRMGQNLSSEALGQTKSIGLMRARKAAQEEADRRQSDRWSTTDQQTQDFRDQSQANWEERMAFDREKMAEGNALKLALQDMRTQETGKEQRRYRQALSRDLTKAGIPEINDSIAKVDAALVPYKDKDIPGFGAGKYSPSDEARAMRGKLAGIENILLKARSGAAVTETEYERFRKELLGEGVLATDADFRRSWADLKSRIAAQEEGIVSGYSPEVVDLYYGRESTGPSPDPSPNAVMGDAESYLTGGT